MNLNALERWARRAFARTPGQALTTAETMRYALIDAEVGALRSSAWQTTARPGREENGKPPVVADNPDMGGWF